MSRRRLGPAEWAAREVEKAGKTPEFWREMYEIERGELRLMTASRDSNRRRRLALERDLGQLHGAYDRALDDKRRLKAALGAAWSAYLSVLPGELERDGALAAALDPELRELAGRLLVM